MDKAFNLLIGPAKTSMSHKSSLCSAMKQSFEGISKPRECSVNYEENSRI